MQILEIVLYNSHGDQRHLKFNPGRVNIITGQSGTGKTALIDIVDYCLGRNTCNVPEGIIRDAVVWYGLLLQLPSGQVFVARPKPAEGKASSTGAYLNAADKIAIPTLSELSATTTAEALTIYLGTAIGINPNVHRTPIGQTRPDLEATLRHALYFVFQQQDEIASRKFLFHRQGEQFIPRKGSPPVASM